MNLSEHFTLEELTISQTATRRGLDNTPDSIAVKCLKELCTVILEPLRAAVGPILVTSGYRAPLVNHAIGGASNSQHCLGQAADIHVNGMTVQELFDYVKASDLPFDQLINEQSWLHVSFGPRNRRQCLIAHFGGGAVHYTEG